MNGLKTMKHVKTIINKWQSMVWSKVIIPFADFFKLECEYCWWWRGVLVGSIITSSLMTIFILVG